MPTKGSGGRETLIHCYNCHEDYSPTYRRCPFCNAKNARPAQQEPEEEREAEYEEAPRPAARGGKRLDPGSRGQSQRQRRQPAYEDGYDDEDDEDRGGLPWGRIALYAASALIILAAAYLIFFKLAPKLFPGGAQTTASPSPSASAVVTAEPSPSPIVTPPAVSPDVTDPPITSQVPALSPPPAASFTLSRTEFTLSDKYPTYTVKATGAEAPIIWEIDKPQVATVDQNGLVSAVAAGRATLTATDANGAIAVCTVYVGNFTGGGAADPSAAPGTSDAPAPTPGGSDAPAGTLTLNRDDFTLSDRYPTFTMKATGASGAVTWSVADTSVVTINQEGFVAAVANGKTTITATDASGATATCVVYVANFTG